MLHRQKSGCIGVKCAVFLALGRTACFAALTVISSGALAQDLFVSSYFNGTVVQISPSGAQSVFASGLSTAEGMAFDGAGNLYVAECGTAYGNNGSIIKITPSGVQSTFASGLNSPMALAFGSTGDLFVDSYTGGSIIKISASGAQTPFASGLNYPEGMAFDSKGGLFVTSGASIMKFSASGAGSIFASGLQYPYGVAINSADCVFEADDAAQTLDEFTPGGARSEIGSQLVNVYNCLAIDGAGNIFAGEWGSGNGYNGSIVEITPDGVQSVFASGLYSPTGLAFEPAPEPPVMGLCAIGIVAWLVRRRYYRSEGPGVSPGASRDE